MHVKSRSAWSRFAPRQSRGVAGTLSVGWLAVVHSRALNEQFTSTAESARNMRRTACMVWRHCGDDYGRVSELRSGRPRAEIVAGATPNVPVLGEMRFPQESRRDGRSNTHAAETGGGEDFDSILATFSMRRPGRPVVCGAAGEFAVRSKWGRWVRRRRDRTRAVAGCRGHPSNSAESPAGPGAVCAS